MYSIGVLLSLLQSNTLMGLICLSVQYSCEFFVKYPQTKTKIGFSFGHMLPKISYPSSDEMPKNVTFMNFFCIFVQHICL